MLMGIPLANFAHCFHQPLPRGVLEEFHAERQTEVEVMGKRLEEELASQAASFEEIKAAIKVGCGAVRMQIWSASSQRTR